MMKSVYQLQDKSSSKSKLATFINNVRQDIKRHYQLYLLVLPAIILILIFSYIPMYGILIAFKKFVPTLGIGGSQWVGFKYFIKFFKSPYFFSTLKNTLGLSVYQLVVGFPFPIILALVLNQLTSKRYKRIVQTVTYMPHFISVVVVVGMLMLFTSPSKGLLGALMQNLGLDPINFMGEAAWFKTLYVFTGIWQTAGWGSIIYLAALSGIDPSLYEACSIDGCNKLKKMWYIDLPCLVPTIVVLLLLRAGKLMTIGFEKVYLMQNPLNLASSEIISTYVYKIGLLNSQFSYSAAIGLFNTLINFVLLVTLNRIARKTSDVSLW